MEYRGVEYHVAQAVEVGTWKVSTSLEKKTRTIRAKSRKNAVIAAEHLIDKALAPKKRRTCEADRLGSRLCFMRV
jgi:hypothetical protein